MPEASRPETNKTVFEEFLLAEYNNIAQAHHISINTMTTFFKHYLLIMSLPISAIIVFFTLLAKGSPGVPLWLEFHPGVILGGSVLLCLIGLLIMLYIINLRFKALLYARTVNGIRSYFVDRNPDNAYYFVLPSTTLKPPYKEILAFGPVIMTFALANTTYIAGAILWSLGATLHALVDVTLVYAISISIHFGLYLLLAERQEKRARVQSPSASDGSQSRITSKV
jgi:hypothetical protein